MSYELLANEEIPEENSIRKLKGRHHQIQSKEENHDVAVDLSYF